MSPWCAGIALFSLVSCSATTSVLRSDLPLPGSWLEVSILLTGSEASDEKSERCLRLARDHGIWVHSAAALKVAFTLEENHNRVTVGRYGAPPLRDEIRPQWSMQSLCLNALTMAAEAAGRSVAVMKIDPASGCVMRGAVEGKSVTGYLAASYEEAISDAMLRAAQQGMNYLALDAVEKKSSSTMVSGRGFVCAATPANPAVAPAPNPAAEDE
jgi:hypothetical protein